MGACAQPCDPGPPAARVLVFVDDDCFVARDFLRVHLEAHRGDGPGRRDRPSSSTSTSRRAMSNARCGHPRRDITTTPFRPATPLGAGAASCSPCGLFDEDFNVYGLEDMEIWERFRRGGARSGASCAARGALATTKKKKKKKKKKTPKWTRPHFRDRLRTEVRRARWARSIISKWPKFGVGWQTKQPRCHPPHSILGVNAFLDSTRRRARDISRGLRPVPEEARG